MSTPCEEIRPELEALLGAMTEGGLDAPGRKRLAEILHDHPDARQVYLDYCQMHALLRSAHGELSAIARPRRRVWPYAAAAAAILLVGLIALRGRTVATVDGRSVAAGQRVTQGDVRYVDGSQVSLLERSDAAVFKDHVELHQGVVRCEVKPRATPFSIKTRQAEATVLGTSFEVASERDETRLSVASGRVRLSTAGREVVAGPGEVATSDGQDLAKWTSVCDLKFAEMTALPPQLESVFCPSKLLHTPGRTVTAEPLGRFLPGGFHLGTPGHEHGLHVWRWREEVGDDVLIEADVAGGQRWSLGFSMSGDPFEGYRIIFAVMGYPEGISIDTIHPVDCVVLAQDPRPINFDRDHTLRAERRGRRMRVWIDRELRLDTEIAHPLPEGRRRTFAISNYGAPPLLRGLRVWKAAP